MTEAPPFRLPFPGSITLIVLTSIAMVLLWPDSHNGLNPPEIDLTDVEPAVAQGLADARQSVIDAPNSAECWSQLGMTCDAHEYSAEALACYQEASRLDPHDARWPYLSGTILYATDRDASRKAFQTASDLDPDKSLYRVRLAEACLDAADLTAAETNLEAARETDPSNARVLFRLAQLRLQQGAPDQALSLAEAALEVSPRHRAILQFLVTVHGRVGTQSAGPVSEYLDLLTGNAELIDGWPDAIRSQVQLFRLDAWWLASQGETQLAKGDTAGSIALLRKAVSQSPSNPAFRARLVNAYLRSGQLMGARKAITDAPVVLQNEFDLLRMHVTLSLLNEDWSAAVESARKALARKPDSPALLTDLGFALRQSGHLSAAIAELDRAVTLNPHSSVTWQQLAETYAESDQRTLAEKTIHRALEFLPDDSELQRLSDSLSE